MVICDTDFHPLDPQQRAAKSLDAKTAPITIADDVFIGMNALILKGVAIGAGAVIGAGSVVPRDVPAGAIVAGNPAQILANCLLVQIHQIVAEQDRIAQRDDVTVFKPPSSTNLDAIDPRAVGAAQIFEEVILPLQRQPEVKSAHL